MNSPENSYLTLHAQSVRIVHVCLQSENHLGYFTRLVITFSAVSRIRLKEFTSKFRPGTESTFATDALFFVICQNLSIRYTWRAVNLLGCISASIRGISWKFHILHLAHIRYKRWNILCDWSHFTWTAQCLLGCNLASIGTISMEIHTWHSAQIHYKFCEFCWGRRVVKGSVLEEGCTFSVVCQLPLEGFSWLYTIGTPNTFATTDVKFGFNRSIVKSTVQGCW